jgi:hypothetical protein
MAGKPNVRLETIGDVSRFLGKLINKVERGQVDGGTAGRLAYIANILIGALKDSELEGRVKKLENLLDSPSGKGQQGTSLDANKRLHQSRF